MLIDGFDIDFYLKMYPKSIKFFKSKGIDGLKNYHYLNGGINNKTYEEYLAKQNNNNLNVTNEEYLAKQNNNNLTKTNNDNLNETNNDNLNVITELNSNNLPEINSDISTISEHDIDIDYILYNYPLSIKYYKSGGINGLVKYCNKFKIALRKIEYEINKNTIVSNNITKNNTILDDTKTINVLAIFGNINSSNASSIQIKSLIKSFSNNINLIYYSISDDCININSIKDYDRFYTNALNLDTNKITNTNEIKTINDVENKLKNGDFDIIFGWSNPYLTSTIAIALGNKYNIPVILRLGDFYISEYSKNKLKEYIYAKSLIVPNDILKSKLIKFYGNEYSYKIKTISQHYYVEKYNNIKQYNTDLKILHTGNMYQDRKIDPFINCLSKLENKNKIKLTFIGCHDKLSNDIELCKKNNINADFSLSYQFKNWLFKEAIPFENLRKYIHDANILLHIEYVANENHFLSFKLIDYLSYNKPIITITQKNSPNYYLAKECGFAFGDIEDEYQLLDSLNEILNNPNKYIPNDNKFKYDIANVSKKWENELIKYSNKKNYEFITLLNNKYDDEKIKLWIEELVINSYYENNKCDNIKKYENLYTIWVMTIPFSESLIYTMQNLNYLGYKYKILINDNEINALNFMKDNTNTKYWFRYDDDFIIIKNSIEYMINIKEKVENPIVIYRLYDLHYGYKFKIPLNCFARYGIKIHDTQICKKLQYNNKNNSDIFYKELEEKYGKYLNYRDWENNGKIVGYHQLFCNEYDIYLLYVKMSYKFILYNQDIEIIWNYFIELTDNRLILINFLKDFNKKTNCQIEDNLIDITFNIDKFSKYSWLKKKDKWTNTCNNIEIENIYNKLYYNDYFKLYGFLIGLKYDYEYNIESYIKHKLLFNKINEYVLNTTKNTTDQILIIDDINNINYETINTYKVLKEKDNNLKVYSKTPLISLCDKIDIYDLINFPSFSKLQNYIHENNIKTI